MRTALLSLVLLAACDTQDGVSGYDAYDPDAVAMNDMMEDVPVAVTEAEGALLIPDGVVLAGFTAPTMGRFTYPGFEPGIAAGDAACRDLGGDHVCTDKELDEAEEAGDFEAAGTSRDFWINRPGEDTGNCLGWAYEGAHIASGNYGRSRQSGDRVLFERYLAPVTGLDGDCLSDPGACPSVVPSGFPCNEARSIVCCK